MFGMRQEYNHLARSSSPCLLEAQHWFHRSFPQRYCFKDLLFGEENTALTYTKTGPTIDFAASLRGNSEDAGPGRQALWKHFATRRSGKDTTRVVELSQNSEIRNTLKIRLDRYQPLPTDKQYYPWFEDGVEQRYYTPAYGITNLLMVQSAIEKFLDENLSEYIEVYMRNASKITQRTFHTAQQQKVRRFSLKYPLAGYQSLTCASSIHPSLDAP